MASTSSEDAAQDDNWTANCVFALPELWGIIAEKSGLVGAWRLTGVCRASREGAKVWLRTLPGVVVCGGRKRGWTGIPTNDVWSLDLATLQWAPMPALVEARSGHACCAVRGSLVILGGSSSDQHLVVQDVHAPSASVEMLSPEGGEFVNLPPLSRGDIEATSALAVEESDSAVGQVILLGGVTRAVSTVHLDDSTVHLVDLATGECTPHPPPLLHPLVATSAARLPDGRIVFFGYNGASLTRLVAVLQPPDQGDLEHVSTWKPLPLLSLHHSGGRGCVLSDGRFAVLGGQTHLISPSCEALTFADNDGSHWDPPTHVHRTEAVCMRGCRRMRHRRGRGVF
jgi:hypothetical protein